jgi:hypothetical protein
MSYFLKTCCFGAALRFAPHHCWWPNYAGLNIRKTDVISFIYKTNFNYHVNDGLILHTICVEDLTVTHYLIKSIRTPTRNCNPTFPMSHFPVMDINTGGPTLCLYESCNSARKTFYKVSECLQQNGSSIFPQSCSQGS